MGKKIIVFLLTFLFLITIGCGQDLPFEYQYVSANMVQIKYLNSVYELSRYGDKINAPFEYEFEADGDLEIIIADKAYDIDKSSTKKKIKD